MDLDISHPAATSQSIRHTDLHAHSTKQRQYNLQERKQYNQWDYRYAGPKSYCELFVIPTWTTVAFTYLVEGNCIKWYCRVCRE
jgi:hypothetical protein